jgi:hypothetical protein
MNTAVLVQSCQRPCTKNWSTGTVLGETNWTAVLNFSLGCTAVKGINKNKVGNKDREEKGAKKKPHDSSRVGGSVSSPTSVASPPIVWKGDGVAW